jgi:anti-sigma regulatory factor (Ser/Thr protein kinase)
MLQSRRLPRAISSLDEMFAFLAECFEGNGVDEKSAFCINLAAEELFTNMVRHNVGSGDSISVETEISPERILFRLTDSDVEPFDPDSAATAKVDAPIEERKPGGLGLHLVRSMVNEVKYEYDDATREMRVTVIKLRGH